jgi:hypothetical protein
MVSDWREHVKRINAIITPILDRHGIVGELRVAFRNYALKIFRIVRKYREWDREDMIKAVKAWYFTRLCIDPDEIRKILNEIADAVKEYIKNYS